MLLAGRLGRLGTEATASTASRAPTPWDLLPPGRPRRPRWLTACTGIPRSSVPEDFGEQRLTELIKLGAGVPELEPAIRAGSVRSSFAAQIADLTSRPRQRVPRRATPRIACSPRGGTGHRTAASLHDGSAPFGWKLGWGAARMGRPCAPEKPQRRERRPVVRAQCRCARPTLERLGPGCRPRAARRSRGADRPRLAAGAVRGVSSRRSVIASGGALLALSRRRRRAAWWAVRDRLRGRLCDRGRVACERLAAAGRGAGGRMTSA